MQVRAVLAPSGLSELGDLAPGSLPPLPQSEL